MNETWTVLIPILITDAINPVLFASMVFAAGTSRPVVNSSAVLLGHTLAYVSAGILLALGLESLTHRLMNPHHIDFILSLIVGFLLLWVAFKSSGEDKKSTTRESEDMTPLQALGLGAVVNFVGIPFALPYFAALDQILKANVPVAESLVLLGGYNLLYALPFAMVPVLTATMGEQSQPILQSANNVLERVGRFLMPILLALVGFALIVDAILYFVTGKGLF